MQFTDSNGNLLVAADEIGGTLNDIQRLAALATLVDAADIPRQVAEAMTDDELSARLASGGWYWRDSNEQWVQYDPQSGDYFNPF
jgi:hypothetical protein